MGLDGRVAVVTGGARGIGEAICMALADQGADIVVADIDFPGAQRTAEQIAGKKVRALAVDVDVASRGSVRAMVGDTLKHFGRVDILVNNAGICPWTSFDAISDEEWERVIAVNLRGPFLCTQEIVKVMAERGWGRIIAISSVAGKMGALQAGAHYCASKGGLIAMTLCVARKYAHRGITANVIAPGQTETELIRDWSDEARREFLERIPVGRMGQPRDIAAAVAFLASEEAGFVTGEVLDVNGGFLMD